MSETASMAASGSGKKFSASAEDQCQINKFARLHKNCMEAKAELKLVRNELQNLNDAGDELMLLDDADAASVPFRVASVFVHYDQDEITEKLERARAKGEEQATELEGELARLAGEMAELKAKLYAKFGDNIHLEDGSGEEGDNNGGGDEGAFAY